MRKQDRRRPGPRTVYDRPDTETMKISPLAKRLLREAAERSAVSIGDLVEHLARTRAADVRPEEFAA